MTRFTARIAVLVLLSAVTASAQLSLAMLKPFQTSPVAVGARLNAGWVLPNKQPEFSLSGEALFPVTGGFRVRASVIDIVLNGIKLNSAGIAFDSLNLSVNSGLSLDAMASTRIARSRIWPYAWLGPELGGTLDNLRLGLRAGVGAEGAIQRGTALFGELGLGYSQPMSGSGTAMLRLRAGLGVRLGKFVN